MADRILDGSKPLRGTSKVEEHPASRQGNSGLSELRKETLYEQAYEQLRRALMAGHMVPGSSISLRKLADELGVSPMPVRDALNRLISQGALELLPNRTVRVPVTTQSRFQELTDVRCSLEGELARRATTMVTEAEVASLVGFNERMKSVAGQGDIRHFLELNYEFHFALYGSAQSPIRLSIVETLWLQAGPALNEYLRKVGFVHATDHHAAICAGLGDRNAQLVEEAVRNDIRDAAAAVLRTLQ